MHDGQPMLCDLGCGAYAVPSVLSNICCAVYVVHSMWCNLGVQSMCWNLSGALDFHRRADASHALANIPTAYAAT
eukprot:3958500-Pyramimonas_sp.AAC.1